MKGFLGAGLVGFLALTSNNSLAQTNGWLVRNSPVTEHLYAAEHGNGTFVVVGNHQTILSSPDGVKWTVRRHTPLTSGTPLRPVIVSWEDMRACGGEKRPSPCPSPRKTGRGNVAQAAPQSVDEWRPDVPHRSLSPRAGRGPG